MKNNITKTILALCLIFSINSNIIKADEITSNNSTEKDTPLRRETFESVEDAPTLPKTSSKDTLNLLIRNYDDWIEFSEQSKSVHSGSITLANDLDLSKLKSTIKTYINKGVVLNGNDHTIKNLNNKVSLITYNFGIIRNVNFNNNKINASSDASIINENYGIIENTNFYNSYLSGYYYTGNIAKNHGIVRNIKLSNITAIGTKYVGSVAGLNSSVITNHSLQHSSVNNTRIENVTMNNIKIYSLAAKNKKTYRTFRINKKILGEHIGGAVGKNHNATLTKTSINNIFVTGNEFVGGLVGFNAYNHTNTKQKAIVSNSNVKNIKIYAGNRVGGAIGYSVSYQPISLSKISPNTSAHYSIMATADNIKINENITLNGYSEVAGAIGLNYSAKVNNVAVKAKKKAVHAYAKYDEAAGLVADNEFGYINNSYTNINVKARIFQAAGFCADSEGTIINSTSRGNVSTPKEAGGFVGSNLGQIKNSKSYGSIFVQTKIKVITKKKVKVKSKKSKKKKTKYKKITKYYPFYSGNFAAYNGKSKYKGYRLTGKVKKSKYYGKRYLKKKKINNRAIGAYGR